MAQGGKGLEKGLQGKVWGAHRSAGTSIPGVAALGIQGHLEKEAVNLDCCRLPRPAPRRVPDHTVTLVSYLYQGEVG